MPYFSTFGQHMFFRKISRILDETGNLNFQALELWPIWSAGHVMLYFAPRYALRHNVFRQPSMSKSRETFEFIQDAAGCGPSQPPQHAPVREITT